MIIGSAHPKLRAMMQFSIIVGMEVMLYHQAKDKFIP
jgi:hypothetical protein